MGVSQDDYVQQLWALLPPGPAWQADLNPDLALAFGGWAAALFRADVQIGRLIDEVDPRTTDELLPDWERVAGLPDACALAFGGEQTPGQRRAALLSKLVATGGMSRAYYLSVIDALGYVATITEFIETTVDGDVDTPLVGDEWAAAWQVNLPTVTLIELTVDDDVDTPLSTSSDGLVECVLNRIKRAGATLVFNYA